VLPVGVNRNDFFPIQEKNNNKELFVAGFYGSFIPLHGIDKIIESAKILKDHQHIQFRIYGGGSEYKKIVGMLKKYKLNNVFLSGEWVKYSELNSLISNFDLCLGIFGESLKTEFVIPNKIYHYSSCRKATLTKETPAIQEIFTQGINILLSKSNPEDMAEIILNYSYKKEDLKSIADEAFNLITEEYNEQKIAQKFIEHAKILLKGT
jgi:glycosyltransferase involved in cell wall biosynthesis